MHRPKFHLLGTFVLTIIFQSTPDWDPSLAVVHTKLEPTYQLTPPKKHD